MLRDEWMEYRRGQEKEHFARMHNSTDKLDSLLVVEVNTTELCNRTCVFCPRHDPEVYPNQHFHMTKRVARKVAQSLKDFNGYFTFSGFGENTMNPNIEEVLEEFSKVFPDQYIEMNTNGDLLTAQKCRDLFDAGLTMLLINLYDGPEQMSDFYYMTQFRDDQWMFRPHWDQSDYGLFINNRAGVVTWDTGLPQPGRPCYYTFSKMMVDWNGNVVFCPNDWNRTHIVGSLLHHDVRDVWFGKQMNDFRDRLVKGDRDFAPCNKCSMPGDLFGKERVEFYYK